MSSGNSSNGNSGSSSSVASILEERFDCTEIDDPIGEADIARFEEAWKRRVPEVLRRFLRDVNGVTFEPPVEFRGLPRISFLCLAGMDSTLRGYGDYAFPFLVPFASSLTGGSFFLDAAEPVALIWRSSSGNCG